MPCSSPKVWHSFQNDKLPTEHQARTTKQKSGDLVSHDVLTCLLCRSATGEANPLCPEAPPPPPQQTPARASFHREPSSMGVDDNEAFELVNGLEVLLTEHQ